MMRLRESKIDPEMAAIVELCHKNGLSWTVNAEGTEIAFRPLGSLRVIARFAREEDPQRVLDYLSLHCVIEALWPGRPY